MAQIKKILEDLVLVIIANIFLIFNTKSEKKLTEFDMQVLNCETNYFLFFLRS